jgi:hypothetical protein
MRKEMRSRTTVRDEERDERDGKQRVEMGSTDQERVAKTSFTAVQESLEKGRLETSGASAEDSRGSEGTLGAQSTVRAAMRRARE